MCVDANLESHVSHLDNVPEEELNRLLSMVVDVENLFTCVHKEEDVDTKQVYFYLFRVSIICNMLQFNCCMFFCTRKFSSTLYTVVFHNYVNVFCFFQSYTLGM